MNELKAEYKDYSDSMIKIALESCQYNKSRATRLLNNMAEQRKASQQRCKYLCNTN